MALVDVEHAQTGRSSTPTWSGVERGTRIIASNPYEPGRGWRCDGSPGTNRRRVRCRRVSSPVAAEDSRRASSAPGNEERVASLLPANASRCAGSRAQHGLELRPLHVLPGHIPSPVVVGWRIIGWGPAHRDRSLSRAIFSSFSMSSRSRGRSASLLRWIRSEIDADPHRGVTDLADIRPTEQRLELDGMGREHVDGQHRIVRMEERKHLHALFVQPDFPDARIRKVRGSHRCPGLKPRARQARTWSSPRPPPPGRRSGRCPPSVAHIRAEPSPPRRPRRNGSRMRRARGTTVRRATCGHSMENHFALQGRRISGVDTRHARSARTRGVAAANRASPCNDDEDRGGVAPTMPRRYGRGYRGRTALPRQPTGSPRRRRRPPGAARHGPPCRPVPPRSLPSARHARSPSERPNRRVRSLSWPAISAWTTENGFEHETEGREILVQPSCVHSFFPGPCR